MATLGFERGTAFIGQLQRYADEWQRLRELAGERGRLGDPVMRQRFADVLHRPGDDALRGLPDDHQRRAARAAGTGGVDRQAAVVAVAPELGELATDVLGAEATLHDARPRCSTICSTRSCSAGRTRSTPGRRRCSATSSANGSSGCRRSRVRRDRGSGSGQRRHRRHAWDRRGDHGTAGSPRAPTSPPCTPRRRGGQALAARWPRARERLPPTAPTSGTATRPPTRRRRRRRARPARPPRQQRRPAGGDPARSMSLEEWDSALRVNLSAPSTSPRRARPTVEQGFGGS